MDTYKKKRARSRRYFPAAITDADYTDDLTLYTQVESLQHSLE